MTSPEAEAEAAAAPDRCSAPYRVRFDEAGPDGRLRTSVVLRYAQDLAWFHSSARGFTRAWYAERGLTWLARAAEVGIVGEARVGDELVGTTQVAGWRRVWARRRTDFVDAAGDLVAWTHVDWVLLDARGGPVRIPPVFQPVFGTPDTTVALSRVTPPPTPADAAPTRLAVRPHELDPMDHVNNAAYADWVDERVIAAGGASDARAVPRTVRLEYARAAEAGAEVDGWAWPADGGWWARFVHADGTELLRARIDPR